jgi:hypothetical protein
MRVTAAVNLRIMNGIAGLVGITFLQVACSGGTTESSAGGTGGEGSGSGGVGQPGGQSGSPGTGGTAGGGKGGGGASGADAGVGPDAALKADAGADTASGGVDVPPGPDLAGNLDGGRLPAPPATWQEHWFEHVQNVKLVAYNDDVAIYFDDDVRGGLDWIFPFMTRLWRYTKATYDLGPEPQNRLFAIFHQGKYSGGHPSTYFDASHDRRNVSDCGPGPWTTPGYDVPSHEAGHVVEGANNGIHNSPAFPLWGDSKWMEFYQYDAYVALGMTAEAKRLFDRFTATTDNFPRPGTRWFRDWFYPLWKDHGGAQVMVKFFKLLATHFPKNGTSYSRNLNWGEFVHFMSGAAGKDLKMMATTAFGWPPEREAQFTKARADFSMITY